MDITTHKRIKQQMTDDAKFRLYHQMLQQDVDDLSDDEVDIMFNLSKDPSVRARMDSLKKLQVA